MKYFFMGISVIVLVWAGTFALIENSDRIRQAVRGIKSMFRADGLLSSKSVAENPASS